MNRNFKKIVLSLVFMIFLTASVSAELPQIQYSENESINFAWENISSIGTLDPEKTAFSIDFNPMSKGMRKYLVTYKLDDGEQVASEVEILPDNRNKKKVFPVSAKAGIHDITITVESDGKTLYNKTEKIYVMKCYEKQFMDELSGRGINTHYEWSPYKEDYQKTSDLVQSAGFTSIRNGDAWEFYERQKKFYDMSYREPWLKIVEKRGIINYNGLYYGHGKLYLPERGMTPSSNYNRLTGNPHPQTQESIQALADATLARAKYFRENGYSVPVMETWNEPNARGDKPERMGQIFNDLVRPIKIKYLKAGYYDFDISSLTPHSNFKNEFINSSMKLGLYPYFDRYAAHEYDYQGGFEYTDLYDIRMKEADDFVTEYGGWKKIDITEMGFPIVPGFATHESAAEEAPKHYVICEYNDLDYMFMYDLMDDGTNATYTEHNFGATTYEGKPKLHYMSMANFNNQTNGAIQIGEIQTGLEDGTRAFMYYKDGEPVVVAWSCTVGGNPVVWNMEGENVEVIDNFGNVISKNTQSVEIGRNCVYIKGLSDKWIQKAVHDDVVKLNSEWCDRYLDKLDSESKEQIIALFSKTEETLKEDVSEQTAKELFESYMDAGYIIIDAGKAGKLSEVDVSKLLYRLYRIAESLNGLYITKYSGNTPERIENQYITVYNSKKEDIENLKIKPYTDALLHFVKDYDADLKKIIKMENNPSKAGIIKAWDLMATELLGWYDAFSEYETVLNMGLLIQTPYYDRMSYVNSDVTTEVNLNNFSKDAFEGYIFVYDSKGEKVAQTPFVRVSPNGGYVKTSVTLNTKKPEDNRKTDYYDFSYVDKAGNVLATQTMVYEVADRFEVNVLPCSETAANLSSIKVKIKNLVDSEQVAHINLSTDGSFCFTKNEIDVILAANEEKIVELKVSDVKNTKYHIYTFKYSVTDEHSNVVAEKKAFLSFTNIMKTDELNVSDFDGDISAWENAYPFYINAPEVIEDTGTWKNKELFARGFLKHDGKNIYLLMDIYDEAQLQPFTVGDMWQGDCVQISLDPENNGGKAYADDDFEIGFSVTPLGNEIYVWKQPDDSITSGVTESFKMVRDDNLGVTRYLIKLDDAMISNVNINDIKTLSLNVAVNDNDYLQREGYYQFTLGTADQKAPDYYEDFTFENTQETNFVDGYVDFPVKIGE